MNTLTYDNIINNNNNLLFNLQFDWTTMETSKITSLK